jgi:TetR/AcrR family transcriptional repressor of uid operon
MLVIIGNVTAVVEPATTRERLIDAATEVFVEQGYEGTRLQDVARAAGLTTGAVYSNFRNKGELLFEAIGARSASEIDELLREVHGATLPMALRDLGRRIVERDARALLLDAVVASRRDPDLADHLRERAEGRESWLAEVTRDAQSEGVVDPTIDAEALARLCTTIALGTLVVRALDLPVPDSHGWGDIVDRLVTAIGEGAAKAAALPTAAARAQAREGDQGANS